MSGRDIYCRECSIYVGTIEKGSKLKKGLTFICDKCIVSIDILKIGKNTKNDSEYLKDFFNKLF
jgi:hypothetical protein